MNADRTGAHPRASAVSNSQPLVAARPHREDPQNPCAYVSCWFYYMLSVSEFRLFDLESFGGREMRLDRRGRLRLLVLLPIAACAVFFSFVRVPSLSAGSEGS